MIAALRALVGQPVTPRCARQMTPYGRSSGDWRTRRSVHRFVGCLLIAVACLASGAASAPAAIDQGPIVRVLRPDDALTANNQYLPSGALELGAFLPLAVSKASARTAFQGALRHEGFKSAAITAFSGPGDRMWRSFAIEFASARSAASSLGPAVRATAADVPAGSDSSSSRDRAFATAALVRYSGGTNGLAGIDVLVSTGPYVYGLSLSGKPQLVRRRNVEQVLKLVIGRG